MSQDDPTRPVEQFSDSEEIDPRIDFLAGTVAGAAGLVVGQPFDTSGCTHVMVSRGKGRL